jgi:hypothetical protein
MNRGSLVLALGSFVVAAAAACGKAPPKPEEMDPVSVEEAQAFSAEFEKAVEPCEADKLAPLLDVDTIIRRSVHAADVKKAEREQVYKGMLEGKNDVPASLCANWQESSTFQLLRIKDVGGKPVPLFRNHGDGLNYFELDLGKSKKDGKVRAIDFYIYTAGEKLSDTFARLVTNSVGAIRAGSDVEALEKVFDAQNAGDLAEARRLLASLPQRLRDSKQMRIIGLQLVDIEDPEYLRLVEEFEKKFPNDPAVDLISVDGFFMRKDVKGAINVLDRLEKRVGGDPYLGYMRANAYLVDPTQENVALAEKSVQAAIAGMPDDQEVHIGLFTVQAHKKDYAGATATLAKLREKFATEIDPAELASEPVFVAYFASPEYQAWSAAP